MTACVGLCAAFADGVRKQPLPDLRPPWSVFAGRLERQKSPVQNQPNQMGSPERSKNRISSENCGQHRGTKRSRRKS